MGKELSERYLNTVGENGTEISENGTDNGPVVSEPYDITTNLTEEEMISNGHFISPVHRHHGANERGPYIKVTLREYAPVAEVKFGSQVSTIVD